MWNAVFYWKHLKELPTTKRFLLQHSSVRFLITHFTCIIMTQINKYKLKLGFGHFNMGTIVKEVSLVWHTKEKLNEEESSSTARWHFLLQQMHLICTWDKKHIYVIHTLSWTKWESLLRSTEPLMKSTAVFLVKVTPFYNTLSHTTVEVEGKCREIHCIKCM